MHEGTVFVFAKCITRSFVCNTLDISNNVYRYIKYVLCNISNILIIDNARENKTNNGNNNINQKEIQYIKFARVGRHLTEQNETNKFKCIIITVRG